MVYLRLQGDFVFWFGVEGPGSWFYAFGDNFLNTIYRQYLIDHKPFIKVALAGFLHTILGDCHVIFMIN